VSGLASFRSAWLVVATDFARNTHDPSLALDNLPGEVSFLLEEIREKDTRINRRCFHLALIVAPSCGLRC
jgi:hypothetical protein